MYWAGPVPPGTGRTGPVPTGFANPDYNNTILHFQQYPYTSHTTFEYYRTTVKKFSRI
jgi:hypothetical protein